jgi:hypothetical protein
MAREHRNVNTSPSRREDWETPGDAQPRPHGNTYWLWPGRVLAGEHPAAVGMLPQRLLGLQAIGVTCFIDLTGDSDPVPPYQPLPVGERAARRQGFAIADFGVPTVQDMRRVLDSIAAALAGGEVVYLHCRAGIGRTGTVAGCLLVEQGFTGSEALELVQRKFRAMTNSALARHSPETGEQREFIARWSAGAGRG